MADTYTPQEIQDIFERYNDAIRRNIPISESLAGEMANATKGVKNYTNQLNYSLKQLGSSIKTLSTDIAKGADGASVFNNSVNSTADVISNFASKFGIIGTVLGGVAKAGAAYVGAVNKQSDALYKSFQEISKTGSLGAGGMNEVFTSMQKFGYAVDELGQMSSLLAENSEALAAFSGTAFSGARQLANLSETLQHGELGEKFRNMGVSVDGINKNAAGYIKTQIMLGQSRANMERNLTGATEKYIEQIVAVQKLTGQTREQLEEKEKQAMREQAFAYTQYELKKRANAGDKEAEKEYQRNRTIAQVTEGKMRDQLIGVIGGDIAAGADLMRTAPEAVEKLLNGGSLGDTMDALAKGGQRAVDNLGPLAKFHAFNDFLLPIDELLKFTSQYGTESFNELLKSAEKNSKTTDAATKDQTKMRIAQMNARQSMENFVNTGIDPVTKAMKILAYTVEWLTSLLPGSSKAKAKYEKEQAQEKELQGKTIEGLGKIAAKFESGGNASKVSTGAGDHGGKSYGAFQLSSKTGDVEKFLESSGYADAFKGLKVGSDEFDNKWRELGADKKFADAQQAHAVKTHYNPQIAKLQKSGLDLSSKGAGVQEAVMSTANQYGASTDVIEKALAGKDIKNMSDSDIINAIQDYKASTVASRFRSSSLAVQEGVSNRIKQEREMLQAISQAPSTPEASGAFGFRGTVSGPMSGYKPNITMHGTEELSIRPAGVGTGSSTSGEGASEGAMLTLIEQMNELIYLSKNQLGVNEKILRYQQ